jgi:hypothetical protein
MNQELRQQILSKTALERMVLSYLRMLPGSQHVERVEVVERPNSRRNWAVVVIEPTLSTAADDKARNALCELQWQFRLAE